MLSGFISLVFTVCGKTDTSEAPAKNELPTVTVVIEDKTGGGR